MPEKKRYTVVSEQGAVFAAARLDREVEVGEDVELDDVYADQEKALVAAGWLERGKAKKEK